MTNVHHEVVRMVGRAVEHLREARRILDGTDEDALGSTPRPGNGTAIGRYDAGSIRALGARVGDLAAEVEMHASLN